MTGRGQGLDMTRRAMPAAAMQSARRRVENQNAGI
jgi:hypothetical protein